MCIEVCENEIVFDEVETFVENISTSLIYGTPRFMKMLVDHLSATAKWLLLRKDGQIIAALPYLIKEGELGPVYNSLAYYGSNGGVILLNSQDLESRRLLVEFFYELAERESAAAATIISNPLEEFATYELFSKFDFRDERIGQITHLPSVVDSLELMRIFSDPRPRNIRKAIREGVTVSSECSQRSIDFLYNTQAENMRAIGGLAKRRSFFDGISSYFDETDWNIFVGSLNGEPIVALLLFYHNETVEYFTPVIVEEFRSSQALALVVYEAMQDAIVKGYKNWNWGGTWLSQGGVYDFKKKWGTTDYPYFYYTRIFNQSLRKATREELLSHYEGFFVLPFSQVEML